MPERLVSVARRKFLEAAIQAYSPDVLLFNYPVKSFWQIAQKFGVRSVMVCHGTSGYISSLSQAAVMAEHTDAGGSLWFVSDYQLRKWQHLAKRTLKRELKVTGLIPPACVEYEPVINRRSVWDFSTVGRCNHETKDPFLLHRLLGDDPGHTSLVMSNPRDCDYYRENLHWAYPRVTSWGDDHVTVLEKMQMSRCFLSTWKNETFGITALEALSQGTPVILNASRDGHASTSIPARPGHVACMTGRLTRQTLLDAYATFPQSDVFRAEVAGMTYEKHGHVAWTKAIHRVLDSASRGSAVSTLEDFAGE